MNYLRRFLFELKKPVVFLEISPAFQFQMYGYILIASWPDYHSHSPKYFFTFFVRYHYYWIMSHHWLF